MVINGHKTLLVRCSDCGTAMKYDLNLFNISREIIMEFKCICGRKIASLKTTDYNDYYLKVDCFVCGQNHFHKLNLRQLFYEDHLYKCIGNIKTCFIGCSEVANKILNIKNIELDEVISSAEYENQVNNFNIYLACINKLETLKREGKIYCECGNKGMTLELFSDRMELKCGNCNSVQIIYAETEEDLEVLLRKEQIYMKKNHIVYLDSLYEKNKDIKG